MTLLLLTWIAWTFVNACVFYMNGIQIFKLFHFVTGKWKVLLCIFIIYQILIWFFFFFFFFFLQIKKKSNIKEYYWILIRLMTEFKDNQKKTKKHHNLKKKKSCLLLEVFSLLSTKNSIFYCILGRISAIG